jgi:hypothetical protein
VNASCRYYISSCTVYWALLLAHRGGGRLGQRRAAAAAGCALHLAAFSGKTRLNCWYSVRNKLKGWPVVVLKPAAAPPRERDDHGPDRGRRDEQAAGTKRPQERVSPSRVTDAAAAAAH